MGKLTIVGKAEREVSYNAVEISITFYNRAKNTAEALRTVMEHSEKFLKLITEMGVDLKNVHIGDNSVSQYYNDDKLSVRVSREMTIRLAFDMNLVNAIMEMVREENFFAEIDCDYHLTDSEKLHMELMQEALEDSKAKAEMIASIMGQKIIGIDSVEKTTRYGEMDWMCCEQERGIIAPRKTLLSNQLKAPLTTESESINVVWLIE